MGVYAIIRVEKCKLGDIGRIYKHHERKKEEYKSNPDIDPSRSHLSYHLVTPTKSYRKMVLERIEAAGARRKKNSVVMQDGNTVQGIKIYYKFVGALDELHIEPTRRYAAPFPARCCDMCGAEFVPGSARGKYCKPCSRCRLQGIRL